MLLGQFISRVDINQTPSVDPATNRFTTAAGFTYDLNGNLIQDPGGRGFVFNGDNKQISVHDSQTDLAQYSYDGNGSRVKKVVGSETTIFVYSAMGMLIAEYSTETTANPTINYLTTDNLGSPRIITDNAGDVVSRRDFMPFGEELRAGTPGRTLSMKYSQSGIDAVRQRFTGYEKDAETGLDYAEARYYDNRYGRFTAVDPLLASGKSQDPQTFNRYVYVANNPVTSTDPSGLSILGNNEFGRVPFLEIDTNLDFYAAAVGFNRPPNYTDSTYYTVKSTWSYTVIHREYVKNDPSKAVTQEATITVTVTRTDTYAVHYLGDTLTHTTGNQYQSSAVDSGVGNNTPSQRAILARTAERIVRVGTETGRSPNAIRLFLAKASRQESHLGIGARMDPGNNNRPEMDPQINPLQIDGRANGGFFASQTDADHNVRMGMDHFDNVMQRMFPNRPGKWNATDEQKLQHYNDGGVIGSKGRDYARQIMNTLQLVTYQPPKKEIRDLYGRPYTPR